MKQTATLLFTLFAATLALAQQSSSKDQLEVQQSVVKLFDALSARDADALRSLCTKDVRFNEYGEAWPIDTLIHLAITKNTDANFKRTNKLEFINTTIRNDVAWTTYNLHSSVITNGKNVEVYWMETAIAVLEQKKWKIKVLHSTRMNKD